MRRLLLALVVPLAVPATAEARCPERDGHRVVQRVGDVVVTARQLRGAVVHRACDRRIGRDPVLVKRTAGDALTRVLVRSRWVAAFVTYADEHGNTWVSVSLVDVQTGRRIAHQSRATEGSGQAGYRLREAVIGPRGHVVWTEGGDTASSLAALAGGQAAVVRAPAPTEFSLVGDVLRWTVDGEQREHRLRPAAPGSSAVVARRTGRGLLVGVRGGRRRPLRIARHRSPWFAARVLRHGYRVAVVEERSTYRDQPPVTGWRVSVWDARGRKRLGPRVVVGSSAAGTGALQDAAFDGERVALSVWGTGSAGALLARLVVVASGSATTVAERRGGVFDLLRLDAAAVAWLEDGEPRSAPLPGAYPSA